MSRRSSSATSPHAERGIAGRETGAALVTLVAGMTILLIGLLVATPMYRYVIRQNDEQELVFRGFEIVKAIRTHQLKQGGSVPISLKQLVGAKFLRHSYTDPISGRWKFIRPEDQIPACQRMDQQVPPVPNVQQTPQPTSQPWPSGSQPWPPAGVQTPPPLPEPTAPGRVPPGAPPGRRGRQDLLSSPHMEAGLGGGLFALFSYTGVLLGQAPAPTTTTDWKFDDPIEGGLRADPNQKEDENAPGHPFIGVMSTSKDESYAIFNGKNHYNEWCFTINTIDQNIVSVDQVRWALMTTPKERQPKFKNEGKKGRDWDGKPPLELPGSSSGAAPAPAPGEGE
jgi:hypothetical protein